MPYKKLDSKGLPESERENACTGRRRYWRFYRCSRRNNNLMSITIMAMIRPGRASQILPFKTLAVAFTHALSDEVITLAWAHATRAQRHW